MGIFERAHAVAFFLESRPACAGTLILAGGGNRDLFVFVLTFITYLLLSWSGEALPAYEYAIALLVAAILYLSLGRKNRSRRYGWEGLSPKRWGLFVCYFFGPFLWALIRANIDVALRIVTGRVKPGIVKVSSGLKSGLGQTVLADSITLTPGTMTVDIDPENGDLYVHWINVTDVRPTEEMIYGSFGAWARRLTQ